jgi:hypothetical protein
MAWVEILGAMFVLVGVVAGFAGVPVLNPGRLIHISIRVRLAAPEQTPDEPPLRARRRTRILTTTAPDPRCFATGMMILGAVRSPALEVGSRWG